jgi:hypothetical protein
MEVLVFHHETCMRSAGKEPEFRSEANAYLPELWLKYAHIKIKISFAEFPN